MISNKLPLIIEGFSMPLKCPWFDIKSYSELSEIAIYLKKPIIHIIFNHYMEKKEIWALMDNGTIYQYSQIIK